MAKILIISYFFPPQNAIAAQRPYSWAKYWSRMDHEVDVLTMPKEFYGDLDNKENFKIHEVPAHPLYDKIRGAYHKGKDVNSDTNTSTKKGLKQKLKGWLISRGLSTSTRMPDPTDLWISNGKKWISSQNKTWDIVVSTYGPYSTHVLGCYARTNGYGKKWCADFRDYWIENDIYPGFPIVRNIEAILEKTILREADIISVDSETKVKHFKQKFYKKVICTPNGFDAEEIDNLPKDKFFDGSRKIISYTGSIYPGKRDPSPLFDYIEQNPDFDYEVHFYGQNVDILKDDVIKRGIGDKVKIFGMLSREDALRIQRDSDVLLYLEEEKNNVNGIIPGKLYEYIYSETPILGIGISENGEAGKLVMKNGCCYLNKINILTFLNNKNIKDSILKFSRKETSLKMLEFMNDN